MRFYVTILALMLSLNAAYAAVVGICDALEHTSSRAAHFGHHSHEHNDDVHDEPAIDADGASFVPADGDHHHACVHPVFSCLLSCAIGVTPFEGCSPPGVSLISTFISAPQALIEHPPKATLA